LGDDGLGSAIPIKQLPQTTAQRKRREQIVQRYNLPDGEQLIEEIACTLTLDSSTPGSRVERVSTLLQSFGFTHTLGLNFNIFIILSLA
jgi:ABC-type methionine transport system ATPase subunit